MKLSFYLFLYHDWFGFFCSPAGYISRIDSLRDSSIPSARGLRPHTHGNVFLRFYIVSSKELVVLDSLENSKQYKNAGKRFRVYGALHLTATRVNKQTFVNLTNRDRSRLYTSPSEYMLFRYLPRPFGPWDLNHIYPSVSVYNLYIRKIYFYCNSIRTDVPSRQKLRPTHYTRSFLCACSFSLK